MFLCLFKLCVLFVFVCCRFLGVPPGRGSCPLTGPLPFDLIYTDYHGLQQMKQHMGLSLRKHKSVSFSLCDFFFLFVYQALRALFVSLHPFQLPLAAFLMKYFAVIGLLARLVFQVGDFTTHRQNSPFGGIRFGLFALRSINQVQASGFNVKV